MPRKELEALQLERLKWVVDYCYRNVPFYQKRLDQCGVTADKIKQLSDVEYIPFTTKEDIRDNYPKFVLRTDDFAGGNYEGIQTMHVADFLLSDMF